MKTFRMLAAGLAATGLVALGIGCGEGKPSVDTSKTEATVKGTVKLRGKALNKGEIRFDPSNYLRKDEPSRRAPIGADGSYEIKTLIGTNRITFGNIPAITRDPLLQDVSYEFDVKDGENTYDIEIPPPPPTP